MHKTGLKRMGMTGNPHPKDLSKSPAVAGFDVYKRGSITLPHYIYSMKSSISVASKGA